MFIDYYTIHLNVFVHKACQYNSLTEYFLGWSFSSVMIKSCIVKELFPVCAHVGLTRNVKGYREAYSNNATLELDFDVKKHF